MSDNYSIWLEHDNEVETWRHNRPKCDCCGEHIQDDYYFEGIGYGKMCEECFDDEYKHDTPEEALTCVVCDAELDAFSYCIGGEWYCEDCAKDDKEWICE